MYDGLGSVVGEVNVTGNVTGAKLYDVYGATRSIFGTPTSRQGFVGGLGHESDDETGLVYMRARYYDPLVGRFASEDPGGNGSNLFIYCCNNPVNMLDADGKIPRWVRDRIIEICLRIWLWTQMEELPDPPAPQSITQQEKNREEENEREEDEGDAGTSQCISDYATMVVLALIIMGGLAETGSEVTGTAETLDAEMISTGSTLLALA